MDLEVKIINLNINETGKAIPLNLGVEHAKGKYIVVVVKRSVI